MSEFMIAEHDLDPDALVLEQLKGFELDFALGRWQAKTFADGFPSDVVYVIDGDPVAQPGPASPGRPLLPASLGLSDSLRNTDSFMVVSEPLKQLIAQHEQRVEFLPVTLVTPKKKRLAVPYFIVNPLAAVDAIDRKKSKLRWEDGGGSDDTITTMGSKLLVLDEQRVPADRSLFLLKHLDYVVVVRNTLAEAIRAAKLTGVRWVPIKDAFKRD